MRLDVDVGVDGGRCPLALRFSCGDHDDDARRRVPDHVRSRRATRRRAVPAVGLGGARAVPALGNRQRDLQAGRRQGRPPAADRTGGRTGREGRAVASGHRAASSVRGTRAARNGRPSDDYPWAFGVYRWLEGEPLAVDRLGEAVDLATDLAELLRALRRMDTSGAPVSSRGGPLAPRDEAVRGAIDALAGRVDARAATRRWEVALRAPAWAGSPTWLHGDLMPGNLLFVERRLSAVIDFSVLGVGDPAADLLVAWWLLTAETRPQFRAALGVDEASWARGRGWALSCALIALPYYSDTNPLFASYARRAIAEVPLRARVATRSAPGDVAPQEDECRGDDRRDAVDGAHPDGADHRRPVDRAPQQAVPGVELRRQQVRARAPRGRAGSGSAGTAARRAACRRRRRRCFA